MDDGSPGLEIGFDILFGDSFAELLRLNNVIDAATANAVKEFAAVQRASKGMLDMGGATAQMTSFGGATKRELESVQQTAIATGKTVAEATRDFRALASEKSSTERQAERLIRTLEREASTLGRTKDEIRAARTAHLALTAAQQGNTDVAVPRTRTLLITDKGGSGDLRCGGIVRQQFGGRDRSDDCLPAVGDNVSWGKGPMKGDPGSVARPRC